MKYSRLSTRMVPSSLQDWLEEELESRGIDGVVYTRYILSLLQDDESSDEIDVDSDLFGSLEANPNMINCCTYHNKRKYKCRSNKLVHRRYQQSSNVNGSCQKNNMLKCCDCAYEECCRLNNIDQKRSVVVECLKSASEQDFEIESLVDELCAKLKEYKRSVVLNQVDSQPVGSRSVDSCHDLDSSPKEQAKKYFAAFPALNTTNVFEREKPIAEISIDLNRKQIEFENDFECSDQKSNWDGKRIIEFAKKSYGSIEKSDSSVDEVSESRQVRQVSVFGLTEKVRNPIEDITNVYNESNIYKVTSFTVGNTTNAHVRFTNEDRFAHAENMVPNFVSLSEKEQLKCGFENEIVCNDEWENEKLKVLVSKFNNKVASLWNDEKGVCKVKKSIWCFENTNWSPQSSSTPSPKLNDCAKNKWLSAAPFDEASALWEPLQKRALSYALKSENVGTDIDEWFGIENNEKILSKAIQENKTSLSNHGDDSLFVEVTSRRNGSFSENFAFEKQAIRDSYVSAQDRKEEESESTECLLTSPKTHFQPIKQDSFGEEYDDVTTFEADAEVSRLVPCSSICPNNVNNELTCDSKSQNSEESKGRSLSTSLPELTLFMGPFTDNELEEEKINIEERHSSKACVDCEEEKRISEGLSSSEENEFEELCTMLNEVLREETNSKPPSDAATTSWFDSKEQTCDGSSEQGTSWNRFWGSLKSDTLAAPHHDFYSMDTVHGDKTQQENEFLVDTRVSVDDDITAFPMTSCKYGERGEPLDGKSVNWFKENEYLPLTNDGYDANIEWSAGVEYEYSNVIAEDSTDTGTVFCCWNLEKEWQKEENDENSSEVQQRKIMEDWSGKRPCTFFMEGNCRRSDCKFSHDLGSITCKFWEEGCCFKGYLCPFLHGYPSESINYKAKVGNPKFLIESEADFPSLSTGNSEAYLSESSESNISTSKNKGKRFKQESNVLYRMVKKKRKKAGHQSYNEKAV